MVILSYDYNTIVVAKFLYSHDGNDRLPIDRDWKKLAPYWQNRYIDLAKELIYIMETL